MSLWTHSICDTCWIINCITEDGLTENEEIREPVRMVGEFKKEEMCCWCGQQHKSGIYARSDPKDRFYCHHGKDHE